MIAVGDNESADSAVQILRGVRQKGVRLWLKNGQLRVKAPGAVLTNEDRRRLKACGQQIARALAEERNHTVEHELETPVQLCAPLTFSQLAHWRLYRLAERPGVRSLASALRLQGRLDIGAFERSLDALFRRHDALRTRIAVREGIPEQHVGLGGNCRFAVEDLNEQQPDRRIEQLLLEPVDVTTDPLVAIQLLKLSDAEHVLIVAVEHIIADAVSMQLLLRDLLTAYSHTVRGQPVISPIIETQFSDHAVWQRSAHATWLDKHGDYWRERLRDCPRLRWPADIEPSDVYVGVRPGGWSAVPIRIDGPLRGRLHEWCRLKGTTVPMAVFTAFVAVVLRWCNAYEAVFQFMADGRTDPRVEHTIGYFASPLLMRLELRDDDRLGDLLERIVTQYVEAHQHADHSYIESHAPRPDFTRNSIFNWISHGRRFDCVTATRDDAVASEPFAFENPLLRNFERDNEPSLLLVDYGHEIAGFLQFRRDRHSAQSMQTVGRHLLSCIEQLGAGKDDPHCRF